MIEDILTPNQRTLQAFRNVFDTSLQLTVFSYSDRIVVIEGIVEALSARSVESIMTPDGISSITDEVFSNPTKREFFMTLQATFFSLMGEYHKSYKDLAESFAYGMSAGHINQEVDEGNFLLTPSEFSQRIFDYSTAVNYLLTNKWLLVYVMAKIWGRFPTAKEIRDAIRKSYGNQPTMA